MIHDVLKQIATGHRPDAREALSLAETDDLHALTEIAAALRDQAHPDIISYSRKVFIPLTHLCRDVCHYCTFAQTPRHLKKAFMTPDDVLGAARAAAKAGCTEALFTLGDKPELRYALARKELAALGHETTLSYLTEVSGLVLRETGLLPHVNPGVMTDDEIAALREVSVSQGLMLESASARLCEKGGPHFGSPDKDPAVRIETMRRAGAQAVPFTSGILIGIGETRVERIETLLALRELHDEFGHIQEVIVQNFRAKPDTKMAEAPEPSTDELVWTIAVARLIFGPEMNIQAPPNLSAGALDHLVGAGINDWGGVSPVTRDFVNPEAPWPALESLAKDTARSGKQLVPRLALYPAYVAELDRWVDEKLRPPVMRSVDAEGYARMDSWSPGTVDTLPRAPEGHHGPAVRQNSAIERALGRVGQELGINEITALFGARGEAFHAVCKAADELRKAQSGDAVSYVVNRNINYTNICTYRCQFCAFSKGKLAENLRGRPYDLPLEEIQRRTAEAWARGASEVCLQGGIHPAYTGQTYLDIFRAVIEAAPDIHVHAFSPLEIWQGAETLGLPLADFLARLKEAGLSTLPGTAAEILDDSIREIIAPDKIMTEQWLAVMRAAHSVGLRSTATIMYGHVEGPLNWARHLMRVRELQAETGMLTEFVPLPFVHMEAPMFLKGKARPGPTFREAVLMHAVARLVLHPLIDNIQTSWVKMGPEGVATCLNAGANDLGGTLMNESITRAAGSEHGQEMPPEEMERVIASIGRLGRQRTTLYGVRSNERVAASFSAPVLTPTVNPLIARERPAARAAGGA
jgi:FO synthase